MTRTFIQILKTNKLNKGEITKNSLILLILKILLLGKTLSPTLRKDLPVSFL
jgi:hypothetical protein